MACSTSFLQGQVPIQCQLCETDPKINWKCLQCNLLMCSKCKDKIHPKFKSADEHKIVSLKELSASSDQSNSTTIKDTKKAELYVTVDREFVIAFPYLYALSSSSEESMWICAENPIRGLSKSTTTKLLQKVRTTGYKLEPISSFNIEIYDIAVTLSHDLLLVTDGKIKQIRDGTNVVTDCNYSVAPLQPISIHVTHDYKVIVGAAIGGELFSASGRRVVIIMDKYGIHQTVFEHDKKKEELFTLPYRVLNTSNGTTVVLDRVSLECHGRLVFLGPGDRINYYTGHPEINTMDKPFKPFDIAVTSSGNIFVTDELSLHILTCNGQLMAYYEMKTLGISNPQFLAINMSGRFSILYIGCSTTKESSDKCKLYRLNISGF